MLVFYFLVFAVTLCAIFKLAFVGFVYCGIMKSTFKIPVWLLEFLRSGLFAELDFFLGSFLSFCKVFSVRAVVESGLLRLYGSMRYVRPK